MERGAGDSTESLAGLWQDAAEAEPQQVAQAEETTGENQPAESAGELPPLPDAPITARIISTGRGDRIILPEGASVDTIMVRGDDLILIQEDGSLIIIVGGAKFPPTLVVAGVEVPVDQLAGIIEGAKPGVPAAGPEVAEGPPTTAPNFNVNPGFIGDPFPIGALLPPTALLFGVPEPRDLLQIIEEGAPPLVFTGIPISGLVEEEQFSGREQQSDAGPGNADTEDQDGNDTDETLVQVTLHIEGELAPAIGGGTPPYTFSIFDVTSDADLANDLVQDANGTPIQSLGVNVFYVFVDATTIQGWADDDGDGTGDRLVFTLTVAPDGHFTFDLNDQIDHPIATTDDGTLLQGSLEETLFLNLSSVIQVSDSGGQTAVLSDLSPDPIFTLGVIDDTPILSGTPENRAINEDDINTLHSRGTSPNYGGDPETESSTENNAGLNDPAIVTGNLAGVVSFGADAHPENTDHVMFRFAGDPASVVAYLESLNLYSKHSVEPATNNGIPLIYSAETTGGFLIITAYEPDPNVDPGAAPPFDLGATGNIVFELRINQFTGDYEFRLFDELIHLLPPAFPNGSDENTVLRSGIDGIDFGQILEAVDYDGDAIRLGEGTFVIEVIDDVPEPAAKLDPLGVVQHDETPGIQNTIFQFPVDLADSDTNSAAVKALFATLEADPTIVTGEDPDVPPVSGAIGYARSLLPVVLENAVSSEVGADAPPAEKFFNLTILDPDSGLQVTDGSPITLEIYDNGTPDDPTDDLILGRVQGGAFDQQIAFAIAIETSQILGIAVGNVSVAQYLSLFHPTPGSSHDETVNLSGKIGAVFTIVDSDGDSVSTPPTDIGGNIRFDDDGPRVDVRSAVSTSERDQLRLAFDESVQPDGGDDDSYDRYNTTEAPQDNNGGADDVDSDPPNQNYNQIPVVETAPDSNEAIGSLTTNVTGGLAALFNVNVNFGADGPLPDGGQQPSRVDTLSLNLTGNGQTNLVVTALGGTPLAGLSAAARTIYLVEVSPTVVEGRIPGPDETLGTGSDDFVAFRITILNAGDPASAQIQVEQFLPIDHDASEPSGQQSPENPSLFDEQINMLMANIAAGTLQLVLTSTVTDGDLDTHSDTATVTLISRTNSFLSIDDDGPVALDDTAEVNEGSGEAAPFRLVYLIDVSASISDAQMVTALQGFLALTQAYNDAGGDLSIEVIRFRGAADAPGTRHYDNLGGPNTINDLITLLQNEISTLNVFDPGTTLGSGTNYEAGLNSVENYFDDFMADGFNNVLYFFTDGDPTVGAILNPGDMTTYLGTSGLGALISSLGIEVHAFGVGGTVTGDGLTILGEIDNTPGSPINVTDFGDLQSALLGTVGDLNAIFGNVLDNDPGFGADGGYIKSITIDGVTHTFDGTGSISESGATPAGYEDHGTWIVVPTALGGKLTFYFADTGANDAGDWEYSAPENVSADSQEAFTYVLIDGDFDTAQATLTIDVLNVPNQAPTPQNDIVLKNFGGSAFSLPEWVFLLNDTDPDGDPLDISGVSNVSGLDSVTHTAGVGTDGFITIDGNSTSSGPVADGSFQYTAYDGTTGTNATVTVIQDSGSITGTSAGEIFAGDSGSNTFTGGGGRDAFFTGGGNDTIIGDQDDYVFDGGAGTDTLQLGANFTSTSNAQIVNIENITLTASGLTLNLSNQTEGFTINAHSGGSTITAGTGGDTININAGTSATSWTVNLGADTATDKVVFTHASLGITDNTVATISNFNVAHDRIAIILGSTNIANGTFVSISATGSDISSGQEVIHLTNAAWTTASLTDDSNGGTIEQFIATAIDDIPAGNYTVIVYSNTTASADAGIYTMNVPSSVSGGGNLGTTQFSIEHIMTLLGVGYNSLTTANFVDTADPIVFDLGSPGISFSSFASGVAFDINADGALDRVAWTSGEDGFLVYDLDGSGKIESGTELVSPFFNGGGFASSLAALASLDSNADGVIDANDAAYASLQVWQDANHDGITDAGELKSLAELGISSINLGASASSLYIDGQAVLSEGTFTFADGSTGTFIEVDLDASLGTPGEDSDAVAEVIDAERDANERAVNNSLTAAALAAGVGVATAAASAAIAEPVEGDASATGDGETGSEQSDTQNQSASSDVSVTFEAAPSDGEAEDASVAPATAQAADAGTENVDETSPSVTLDDSSYETQSISDGYSASEPQPAAEGEESATDEEPAMAPNWADSLLQQLAALDSNNDGVIDGNDEGFQSMSLWHDADQDGVADPDELLSFSELGLSGIALGGTPAAGYLEAEAVLSKGAYSFDDGSSGLYFELALERLAQLKAAGVDGPQSSGLADLAIGDLIPDHDGGEFDLSTSLNGTSAGDSPFEDGASSESNSNAQATGDAPVPDNISGPAESQPVQQFSQEPQGDDAGPIDAGCAPPPVITADDCASENNTVA